MNNVNSINGMELAVYKHSAQRYNNGWGHNVLAYWGRIHMRSCNKLGMPSLLIHL